MSVRNDIEMVIKKSNIDFFGVASLDRFEYAPEGRKPTDIMPNAKSVISLGIKIPRGVMIAQTQFYKGFDSGKFIYQQYSYHVPNLFLDSAAMNVAQMLENKYGWSSIPIPNAMPFARASLEAVVSHRQVACAAGLGEMGWSNVMMHPDIGGAGRYTSIITEGDIKPNPLYKGEPLCDPDKCGRICVKACPINVSRQLFCNRNHTVRGQRTPRGSIRTATGFKRRCETCTATTGRPVRT